MSNHETITVHAAAKGWHRVETPDGERFVCDVKIAGVTADVSMGHVELDFEEGGWSIDGTREPWLLIEAPAWYTPEVQE